jgi:hypothetical protein
MSFKWRLSRPRVEQLLKNYEERWQYYVRIIFFLFNTPNFIYSSYHFNVTNHATLKSKNYILEALNRLFMNFQLIRLNFWTPPRVSKMHEISGHSSKMKQNECKLIKVGGEYEKCLFIKFLKCKCNKVQRLQWRIHILSHLFSFFVDDQAIIISCNFWSPCHGRV